MVTVDQYRKAAKKPAGRKHSAAVETRVDGFVFDSRAEADRYGELKLLVLAGEIRDLIVHPHFLLRSAYNDGNGSFVKASSWKADFQYVRDGRLVVEDVKAGMDTTASVRGRQLFRERYPTVWLFVNETRRGG